MQPFRIAHIATQWGLSGVGKAPQLYLSALDRRYFAPEAVMIGSNACARFNVLERHAIPCSVIPSEELDSFLRERAFSVVHIHRTGKHDPWWDGIVRRIVAAGVPIIFETNIFGRADESSTPDLFARQFHISLSSYLKHKDALANAGLARNEKQHVLYYPIESAPPISDEERLAARRKHHIPENAFTLVRVGRADIRKWSDLYFDVFESLESKGIPFWFICRSAPESRIRYMQKQSYGSRCIFLPETSKPDEVRETFAAADVCAHFSRIGESFGYGIAEAMLLGLPCVVDSTPWADNAQIELVEHGKTGFVGNSATEASREIARLASAPAERRLFGERGRAKVLGEYDIEPISRSLQFHLASALKEQGLWTEEIPEAWKAFPATERTSSFASEYQERLRRPDEPPPARPLLGRIGYRGTRGLYWLLQDGTELAGRKFRSCILRP